MLRIWCCSVVLGFLAFGAASVDALAAKKQDALHAFTRGKKVPVATLQKRLLKQALPSSVLKSLWSYHARILRNTIFALKGARFNDPHLRKFFSAKPWYKGTKSAAKVQLSAAAKQNVKRLLMVESLLKHLGQWRGTWPKAISKRGSRVCLTFPSAVVVQTNKRVVVMKPGKRGCRVQSKRSIARIKRPLSDAGTAKLRGYFKGLVLLHGTGSSDYQWVWLYHTGQKKHVFKREWLAPTATLSFDARHQLFVLDEGIKFPKSCQKKAKTYDAKEKACWPSIQKRHPKLKGVKRPKCKCRGGLGPFVIGEFALPLNKPGGKLTATGKIRCGCAS